jgi:hypothetical protein
MKVKKKIFLKIIIFPSIAELGHIKLSKLEFASRK